MSEALDFQSPCLHAVFGLITSYFLPDMDSISGYEMGLPGSVTRTREQISHIILTRHAQKLIGILLAFLNYL